MSDELVSALLQDVDLRVLVVVTTGLSREARSISSLSAGSAAILAQGLTAAALMGALQKGPSRINLQLECDGPLRGMFVDADAQGQVRGYVKNRHLDYTGQEGAFRWRAALGNRGFLSVLRDQGGGEHYRSSVELEHLDLALDVEAYFRSSEQVRSHLLIESVAEGPEPLGAVGGVLVQTLPGGDEAAFEEVGRRLRDPASGFRAALAAGAPGAMPLLRTLFPRPDLEVMSRFPVSYSCTCSRERVLRALVALGRAELEDLIAKEGQAEATCQFCTTRYVIPGDELRTLLEQASG